MTARHGAQASEHVLRSNLSVLRRGGGGRLSAKRGRQRGGSNALPLLRADGAEHNRRVPCYCCCCLSAFRGAGPRGLQGQPGGRERGGRGYAGLSLLLPPLSVSLCAALARVRQEVPTLARDVHSNPHTTTVPIADTSRRSSSSSSMGMIRSISGLPRHGGSPRVLLNATANTAPTTTAAARPLLRLPIRDEGRQKPPPRRHGLSAGSEGGGGGGLRLA